MGRSVRIGCDPGLQVATRLRKTLVRELAKISSKLYVLAKFGRGKS